VSRPPLLVMVGPTAVGKTAVAVRLAGLAAIEVVSADSRQVYRGLDIGTGKPTPDERAAVAHHLLDVVDPGERYHAARFRTDARGAIAAIHARGSLPVVVGGTGLYVRALLKGLTPAPPADPVLRAELETIARAHGSPALHARLAALAPEAELASFPPGPAGDAALWPWLLERRGLRARGPVSDGHRHGQLSVATFVDGAPLVAEALLGMLGALGPRLLRAKGWVHVAGRQERGFIERAGLRLELRAGEPWAAGESRQSELVLIGDGLDEAELRRGLWACRSAT
jgi:hypothetical protein